MESTRLLRTLGALGLALALVHCGSDRSSPTAPAPAPAPAPAAPQSVAPVHSGRVAMPVETSALKPEGWKASVHLDPKPNSDGIIEGTSPLLVHIDVCGSNPGTAGGELFYLYDFDFDGEADVIDKGEECTREHKYVATGNGSKKVQLRSNVCVVNGDPLAPGPDTYFSCRTVRVELVPSPESESGGGCHDVCQIGSALSPSCGSCAAAMCAFDDFCCTDSWDIVCVEDVGTICETDECPTLPDSLDLSAVPVRRSVRRP